jgi:hypothetical protein
MITRTLVAFLFAFGMLFGTASAAEAPLDEPVEQPVEQPVGPVGPTEPEPLEPQPGVPDPTDPDSPIDPKPPDPIVGDPLTHDDFFGALVANPELSAFAEGFQLAGFHETLAEEGEWTVFAPADSVVFDLAAFDTEDALATYIVEGAYSYDDLWQLAEDAGGSATLTTIDGREITVEIVDGMLLVAGTAQITRPDLEVANGFVHVVDATFQLEPAPAGGVGG